MKEKSKGVLIIIIGIILWMAYLYDSDMSRYGIYTFFSYNTHEVLSIIPLLSIIITGVLILSLVTKIIREKSIKSHKFFCILLIVLFISQTMYIINKNQTVTTSFVTSINRINIDKMEIVINTDKYDLTLDCPMIVLDLLKTDGTEYGITYEWNKKNPSYGKLCIVQSIN
jgi:glucan phosphoethanolaminetransferase (alkaline phosphatase superfamily)